MPQAELLRRRMRGSDAMFLYFERKEMPLHIGSVAVLDGSFDEESEKLFAARLPELPRYRQRVMFSPLNLTHPSWEYDPEFQIRNHIRRVTLDAPGNDRQLSDLAGKVFTPLMDRNKPLWDLTVVDGLEGGRSALISRVHHCVFDGVSGIALVGTMFDKTRVPRHVEPQPYNPPPLPDSSQLLVEGLASILPCAAERLLGANINLLRVAHAFTNPEGRAGLRSLVDIAPELLRPADRLPYNGACSGVRGYCWTSFPFADIRAIRHALGGTINDVVVTIVTGAVSRYVMAHREAVKNRFVRMMVPVNLRSEEHSQMVGNEISMLPLSVPLDIADPAERLHAVAARTTAMKNAHVADIVALIGTWLGWIPPNLQHSMAAIPFLPQPVLIVNLVCTNVPGPMMPLYANGRQVLAHYPHVPCGSDVGLSVAVSSYNQSLYFGVTYDGDAAPDGEIFRDFLIESYDELREAAHLPAPVVQPARKQEPVKSVAKETAPQVPAVEVQMPEPVIEEPAATIETRVPVVEQPAAVVEKGAAPVVEKVAAMVEQAAPRVEKAAARVIKKAAKTVEKALPVVERPAVPVLEKAAAVVQKVVPKAEPPVLAKAAKPSKPAPKFKPSGPRHKGKGRHRTAGTV